MIKIDGKVFANLTLAMPFFKMAVRVEIYGDTKVTAVPELPAATNVYLDNLPLVKK